MPNTRGALGEALAENFLKRKGFKILARNLRNSFGEIDLVAEENGVIVFVEVKSLKGDALSPQESIQQYKKEHLRKTALKFLQARGLLEQPVRFDVVAVRFSKFPAQSQIEHLVDAVSFS